MKEEDYTQISKNAILSFIEHKQAFLKYNETISLKELVSKYLLFYLRISEQSLKILKSTTSEEDKAKHMDTILLNFCSIPKTDNSIEVGITNDEHPWYKLLNEYKNHILFYIFDEEQLLKLIPLIKSIELPSILLTEFEVIDGVDLPECVSVLDFEFSLEIIYKNNFIATNFPILYHYLNTFEQLFQLLLPSGVIIWDESLFQQEAIRAVSHKHHLKTICFTNGTTKNDIVNSRNNKFYDYNFILCNDNLRKVEENNIYPISIIRTLLSKDAKFY